MQILRIKEMIATQIILMFKQRITATCDLIRNTYDK